MFFSFLVIARVRRTALFSLLFLSACSSHIPATHEIQNPGFLLIGMGSSPQPSLHKVELELFRLKSESHRKPTSKPSTIRLCRPSQIASCDLLDYEHADQAGAVTIKGLPPGWYRLASVRISTIVRNGGYDVLGKRDLNIDFEIKAGRTSYLGHYTVDNIEFSIEEIRRFKALTAEISFANQLARDQTIAENKYTALPQSIDVYIPNKASIRRLLTIDKTITWIKSDSRVILSDINHVPPPTNCGWWCGNQ